LAYGWTPEQINELTLYQIRTYLAEETELGGRVKIGWDQARAMGLLPQPG
jgi:hypothetical protein